MPSIKGTIPLICGLSKQLNNFFTDGFVGVYDFSGDFISFDDMSTKRSEQAYHCGFTGTDTPGNTNSQRGGTARHRGEAFVRERLRAGAWRSGIK